MSWPFGKKKTEQPDQEALMDAVEDSVEAADDERFAQMGRISADLKRRLDLLRRDAELLTSKDKR